MRLIPEVALIGDNTASRLRWTLARETERLESMIADSQEMAALCARNGWTARALAWGHIIAGLCDRLDFDDERGQ